MIYRGYYIQAQVPTWDLYEVNEDDSLGSYIGSGGGDTDYPNYEIWSTNEDGEPDDCLEDEGITTLREAKMMIDEWMEAKQ